MIDNRQAEEHVLGAIMVVPTVLASVLAEAHLRPEHFYRERHRQTFAAIVALDDRGVPPDLVAVADEMNLADSDYLAAMCSRTPAPAMAVEYARLVTKAAEWRSRRSASVALAEAINGRDEEAFVGAKAALDRSVRTEDAYLTPEALSDMAYELMDGGGKEAFPWPFARLNALGTGGYRRGQFIVISGHTHFGKSMLTDQCLDTAAKAGARCCLYMNEMDPEERLGAVLQRRAGVPFADFIGGKVGERDRRAAVRLLNQGLGWGIVPIAGWSAREVAAHIRLHRWDVCAIDILHRFPHREERDLAEIVEVFAECAKLAECALILVAHVNRNRVQSGVRPMPTRGDLRGSGSIENDADVVCFVHREQDTETYEPQPESRIYFDKYRGGRLGGLDATFNERYLRFEPREPGYEVSDPIQAQIGAAA